MGYNSFKNILFSNSSVPNYIGWAGEIQNQLTAMGWVRTTDTGQVEYFATVVSITNAVGNGTTTTYTYTLTSGSALRVGQSIVVTGCTTSAFNQTHNISALGAGTFSMLSAANHVSEGETATGTVNAVAAVPTSNTADYQVWTMNDGGTAIYLLMTNGSSSTQLLTSFSIASGTNGAGTLTGNIVSGINQWFFGNGSNQTATTDCYFCGDTNRLCMLLGRSLNSTLFTGAITIERLHNSDGTDSSEGVSITQVANSYLNGCVIFGVGASTPFQCQATIVPIQGSWNATLFNNILPLAPIFPIAGKIYYPINGMMNVIPGSGLTEGVFVVTTLYGATRTYIVSGNGDLGAPSNVKTLVRFD